MKPRTMNLHKQAAHRRWLERHWPNDPANGDDDDWPEEKEPDYEAIEEARGVSGD